MTGQIARTSMGPIEYRLEGRGPTIMVLNGGHCSRETRLSHERLIEHGFSVLTPSRPGYDSTPAEVGKSAQQAADALAALLDALQITNTDVIGISAAGPTALAFAQRHPGRTRSLVLESAMATDWDEQTKRRSRIGFGRAETITWGMLHLLVRIAPNLVIRALLRDLTVLDADEVIGRMTEEDMDFIKRMLLTSRSGRGFINDIEHKVDNLAYISARVLVMYSPHDRTVSPKNARRLADEIPNCELHPVDSDTHLIWIGASAKDVWQKRLSFLGSS